MSMLDELLQYTEGDEGGHKPGRRNKARQWMGFDELGDFEAIKPRKQSHFDDDIYTDDDPRHAKRNPHKEQQRAKLAALERNF